MIFLKNSIIFRIDRNYLINTLDNGILCSLSSTKALSVIIKHRISVELLPCIDESEMDHKYFVSPHHCPNICSKFVEISGFETDSKSSLNASFDHAILMYGKQSNILIPFI